MASAGIRQCLRDITFYLIALIVISTLGPTLFGYHLVRLASLLELYPWL